MQKILVIQTALIGDVVKQPDDVRAIDIADLAGAKLRQDVTF